MVKLIELFIRSLFSMKWIDIFWGFLMCLVWATDDIISNEALENIPSILLAALRFILVTLLVLPFCRRIPPHILRINIASFSLVLLTYGFQGLGIYYNSSITVESLIVESGTILSIIFAVLFLKESITRKTIIGILIASIGAIVIILSNTVDYTISGYQLNKNNIISIISLSISILGWAIYTTICAKLEDKLSTVEMIGWVAFFGSIQALAMSFLFEKDHIKIADNIDLKMIGLIFYTGICGVIIPLAIFHYLVRRYSVTKPSTMILLIPLFVAIESSIFYNEKLNIIIIVGGILITIGIYQVNISKQQALEQP